MWEGAERAGGGHQRSGLAWGCKLEWYYSGRDSGFGVEAGFEGKVWGQGPLRKGLLLEVEKKEAHEWPVGRGREREELGCWCRFLTQIAECMVTQEEAGGGSRRKGAGEVRVKVVS